MMNTAYSRRNHDRGMSLIEVLMVVAILGILIGIGTVAFRGINTLKRRAECQTNMKFLATAVNSFSFDNEGSYPAGAMGDADTDDYTQVNSRLLNATVDAEGVTYGGQLALYSVTTKVATCATIDDGEEWLFNDLPPVPNPDAAPVEPNDDGTEPEFDEHGEPTTITPFQMGVVYWLGRADVYDGTTDELVYESRSKRDEYLQLSSNTLATCLCYDGHANAAGTGSVLPHIGSGYTRAAADQADPWESAEYPDGMVVARIGGNADWYTMKDIQSSGLEQNGTYFWYARD